MGTFGIVTTRLFSHPLRVQPCLQLWVVWLELLSVTTTLMSCCAFWLEASGVLRQVLAAIEDLPVLKVVPVLAPS